MSIDKIRNKLKNIYKYINRLDESANAYMPKEEKSVIFQFSLLIVMFILLYVIMHLIYLSVLGCNYNFFLINDNLIAQTTHIVENNLLYIAISDIIVSLVVIFIFNLRRVSISKFMYIAIFPFSSIICILYPSSIYHLIILVLVILHAIGIIYSLFKLKDVFIVYSANNNLDYSIVVAFVLILICFSVSLIIEGQSEVDAVYHAVSTFTSNGYGDIVETTVLGKLSSNMLMVIGYIMSTIGTAGLTTIFLKKYFSKKFKVNLKKSKEELVEIKKTNEKISKELEEIKEILKKE